MAGVKEQIANLALGRIGNNGSVENLTTQLKPIEKTMEKWFNQSNRMALKSLKPNFAKKRKYIAVSTEAPAFGYTYQYKYPNDCIDILGLGNIEAKDNDYAIEGGFIMTNNTNGEALPIRYIADISDVSKFPPEYVELLSWFLAYNVNMEITQDVQKQQYLEQKLLMIKREAAALNGIENKPIIKNTSKFTAIKRGGYAGAEKL